MMLRRFLGTAASLAACSPAPRCLRASTCALPTSLPTSLRRCSTGTGASSSSGSSSNGSGSGSPAASPPSAPGLSVQRTGQREPSINCVTLVGVVHDIQTGYVFEDAVTQFTLTTTSLDTTNPTQECVVEKDHHTVRCFGDAFSQEVKAKLSEGNVVCVNGRLRLNPQQEPSCNKFYYFPFIHVQPPHGQVSVVYGDRRAPPAPVSPATGELENSGGVGDGADSGAAAGKGV